MEQFIESFQQYFGDIDPGKIIELLSDGVLMELKAGEHLVREGAHFNKSGLVLQGLMRNYYVTEEGTEITVVFCSEMEAVTTASNLKEDIPVEENIQAIENTTLMLYDRQQVKEKALADPDLARLYVGILENRLYYAAQRHHLFNLNSPDQRYKWVIEHEPHLVNRVQQQMLASYLGIIPSSLSRIKKRMMKANKKAV